MISIEEQKNLLIAIGMKLKKPITAYAIGGTAMMFLGLKDSTLDIDLVLGKEDREEFKEAAKAMGYSEMDSITVYGEKKNHPEMLILKDSRFDLFTTKVVHFYFSDKMKKRSIKTLQFGENLIIKIADYHDIILMKCATDRQKDKDDAISIIENKDIDWEILIGEAKVQIELGTEIAAMELGEFLNDLRKIVKDKIPKKVLDEIWSIVEKQAKEKSENLKISP